MYNNTTHNVQNQVQSQKHKYEVTNSTQSPLSSHPASYHSAVSLGGSYRHSDPMSPRGPADGFLPRPSLAPPRSPVEQRHQRCSLLQGLRQQIVMHPTMPHRAPSSACPRERSPLPAGPSQLRIVAGSGL